MHVFLRTDRLVLRRFTEADVDNLVALDADPKVMRLLTGGKPTPREVPEDDCVRVGTIQAVVPNAPGPLALMLHLSGEVEATNRYESRIR